VSLFQNLLETYEKCKDAAGIKKETADGEADEKKTFSPIFHTTFKSKICITLDSDGKFVNATRDNKETVVIIPCTESSSGRSSGIAPHPLCDQLDYVGGINGGKTSAYLEELGSWEEQASGIAKAKLKAVHTYVKTETMISDLEKNQIFKNSSKDSESEYKTQSETSVLDHEKIRKFGVRFAVEIKGDKVSNVWEDKDIRQSWIDYIKSQSGNTEEGLFDYLCGAPVGQIASQHPKNINSMTGNAKLLSCNDTSGYTFRGRFSSQDDAVIVDYEQSQKMHQTLRWLINNYGYNTDSQTIIVWAVDADTRPPAEPYGNSFNLFSGMSHVKTDADNLSEAELEVDANYSKKLRNLFQGFGNADKIKSHSKKICIAAFDAATTGRMGLTFYQELPQDDYLENVVEWHEQTSYHLTYWIKEKDEKGKEKSTPRHYIGAPSYDDILLAVYGKPRGGDDSGYKTLRRKVRKQLLECMFGNFSFPKSMIDMAAVRASRPTSFTDSNGKFSPLDWDRSIDITCALARKYYNKHNEQQNKEEITLELDENRTERDYLYGRLLAVADNLEQFALYKAEKKGTRATNAVRLMGAFSVKPNHTWGILHKQLIPYINQLYGARYHQSIIDDIMKQFSAGEYENNAPLSPLYLLGFSAQRRAFYNKNKQENITEDENDTE